MGSEWNLQLKLKLACASIYNSQTTNSLTYSSATGLEKMICLMTDKPLKVEEPILRHLCSGKISFAH